MWKRNKKGIFVEFFVKKLKGLLFFVNIKRLQRKLKREIRNCLLECLGRTLKDSLYINKQKNVLKQLKYINLNTE